MPRLSISRFGLLLGGLMTLLAVFAASVDTVGIYEDEGIYESTAQSMVDGKGYRIGTLPGSPPNAKYPFFYPAWLALLKWMVPGLGFWKEAVLKLSNLPILLLFVWIFYRTLRDQFRWPATPCQLTAALAGICGMMMPFALVMMTEIPFTLAVWILLRELLFLGNAERRPRWWLVLAMGIAIYYLRTAGAAILAAVLAFLWLRGLRRKAAILLAGWVVAALPWAVWSRRAADAFSGQEPLLSKLLAYYISYDYHTSALLQAAREDGWLPAAGFAATIVLKNMVTFVEGLGEIFFPVTLIYASSLVDVTPLLSTFLNVFSFTAGVVVAGLVVLGYRQSGIPNKSVLGLAMLFHIALFVAWPWPFAARFLTPIAPLLMIFVAENVRRWSEHVRLLRATVIVMSFLLQTWMLAALFPGGTVISRIFFEENSPYHEGVQWLKERVSGSDVVFSGFTSQWVGRELGAPVVRYNTILSPKMGLKLQFKINPSDPAYANEFAARFQEWKQWAAPRSGRLLIFAEVSLDYPSWQTIHTQLIHKQLRLVWDQERQPVKIFEVTESE